MPSFSIIRWLLRLFCICITVVLVACSSAPPGQTQANPTVTFSPVAHIPIRSIALLTYNGHSGSVSSVVWSPGSTRIASGSDDNTVQVWNATTGRLLWSYNERNYVFAVAWSPDGKYIASGSDDATVRIWETTIGHTALIYRGHSTPILSVAWSPNGKEIASAYYDGTIQLWQPGL